jgi:hypothetical protein
MTVAGSVELEIRALVDQGKFEREIDTPLNRAAAKAGDRFGTVLGKAIAPALRPFARQAGDDFGAELNKRGKEHGLSFGKLVGAGITSIFGADLIGGGFRALEGTITAASDLHESMGKNVAVFHDAAGAVTAFADDSQRNLLLSKQAAIEASATFGNLFVSLGIGEKPAADLSTKLVGLAEDLSSFNNVGTDEALLALRSGLLGEAEPLRKFGVTLSESRIQAEAFALGIAQPVKDGPAITAAHDAVAAAVVNLAKVQREHGKGTIDAALAQDKLNRANDALTKALAGQKTPLTAAQKAQAAYQIILKDTATAQGDAARTADGYANQTRILHKQFADISAELGEKLLPYVLDGERKFSKLVDEFDRGVGTGGDLRRELGYLAEDAKGLGEAFKPVIAVIKFFIDHPNAFKDAAIGMAAFAGASKAASIWNARLAATEVLPAVATGVAGIAASGTGAAAGIEAVGASSKLALPEVAALAAVLATAYEAWKAIKGLKDDHDYIKNLPNTYENLGTLAQAAYDANPDQYTADHPGFRPPDRGDPAAGHIDEGRHALAAGTAITPTQKAANQAAEAAKRAAAATKYAQDQYAKNQQAQADAITAATEAARAAGEKVTEALQTQLDALKQSQASIAAQGKRISDFRSQVLGQVGAFSGITGLLPDNSLATAGGIGAQLQNRLRADALFSKNLATLGKRGLDKGVLAELAQAGPEQGRAIAAALAMGTNDQLKQVGTIESQIRQQAQVVAQQATDRQFGAGAQGRANAELARLNAQVAVLNKQIAAQPALIAKAVDQAQKNAKVTSTAKTRTAVPR